MNNGKRLLSVVGRNYVMPIDTAVRRSPDVKSHTWYMSSDEFLPLFQQCARRKDVSLRMKHLSV